jgi:hypothetical protein
MKITKTELNNLIKEEVVRQKSLMTLKSRKSSILKEMEEIGYAEPDQIEKEEELEEGIFGTKITPENVEEKLKTSMDKRFKDKKRTNWATPGTSAWELAKKAAIELNNVDIYWHPAKKQFLPTKYSTSTHTFGGGA